MLKCKVSVFPRTLQSIKEALPTYLISHPSAVCGRWKQCFEVLVKQQKPGHGQSWRDDEMIAANGTVISAGMSEVRADLRSHTT